MTIKVVQITGFTMRHAFKGEDALKAGRSH